MSDPATGQDCEVDILKETFWRPVAQSPYGPVLAEEDVIGTKVRALAGRGAPRDLIDVFADIDCTLPDAVMGPSSWSRS